LERAEQLALVGAATDGLDVMLIQLLSDILTQRFEQDEWFLAISNRTGLPYSCRSAAWQEN
jgi:hypothetical protein